MTRSAGRIRYAVRSLGIALHGRRTLKQMTHVPPSHVMTRRQALLDTATFAACVTGVGALGYLVEQSRSHVTRLSSEQELFLGTVAAQNLSWRSVSVGEKATYVARTTNNECITITREVRGRGISLLEVKVSEAERPFHFRCESPHIDVRERPLLEALFRQAALSVCDL